MNDRGVVELVELELWAAVEGGYGSRDCTPDLCAAVS